MRKYLIILISLLCFTITTLADTPEPVQFLIGGFTDSSGEPLAAGKVYTYSAGTTSDKDTWQDADKTTPHANPIILDAQGKKLVYADGNYKFRVDDSDDNTLYTLDNLRFGFPAGNNSYAGTTTGSSNAYVASLTPTLLALTDGTRIVFEANHSNTGAATLNVDSLGAIDLNSPDDTALGANSILSGTTYTAVYESSTNAWLLQGLQSYQGTYTPSTSDTSNIAAITTYACDYSKNKNWVDVICRFDIDTTSGSGTSTSFEASLPIATDIENAHDVAGVCSGTLATGGESIAVIGRGADDEVGFYWAANTASNQQFACIFSYVLN